MKRLFISLALIAGLLIGPAAAYQSNTISSHADWEVGTEIFDDGSIACTATTINYHDDALELTMWPDGQMTLYVFFEKFRFNKNTATARIDFDDEVWALDNTQFEGNRLTFWFPDQEGPILDFLRDMGEGNVATLRNGPNDDEAIRTWSLDGVIPALRDLGDCYDKISDENA